MIADVVRINGKILTVGDPEWYRENAKDNRRLEINKAVRLGFIEKWQAFDMLVAEGIFDS